MDDMHLWEKGSVACLRQNALRCFPRHIYSKNFPVLLTLTLVQMDVLGIDLYIYIVYGRGQRERRGKPPTSEQPPEHSLYPSRRMNRGDMISHPTRCFNGQG